MSHESEDVPPPPRPPGALAIIGGFYDPWRLVPGTPSTRRGGFLEGIDRFEPFFVGVAQ